jgi:hypothetical protein
MACVVFVFARVVSLDGLGSLLVLSGWFQCPQLQAGFPSEAAPDIDTPGNSS